MRDDLGLDPGLVEQDTRKYCAVLPVLRTFVARREGSPDAGEIAKGMQTLGPIRTLHVGSGRAVTFWDSDEDVCWLVGYRPTHDYEHFEVLDASGRLLPNEADYLALDTVTATDVLDGLANAASDLYDQARAKPGEEVQASYGDRGAYMLLDLLIEGDDEAEQGWLAVTFPRSTGLDEGAALDLVARLLPARIDLESLEPTGMFKDRPATFTELVFTWSA